MASSIDSDFDVASQSTVEMATRRSIGVRPISKSPRLNSTAIDRRRMLWSIVLITPSWRSRDAQAAETVEAALEVRVADDVSPRFLKTESGVRIQELERGEGRVARPGDRVEIDYVLRRSNGYFVYSTVEGVSFQPRDVPIGPIDVEIGSASLLPGLSDALVGMKAGGRRRVLIPPERGYQLDLSLEPQPPNFAGKRQIANHAQEPFLFEIQLLKIRS